MERVIELGLLLDCYGDLLTERQQSIMAQYAYENCSLAEIAEREGISRQGVRDILMRSEQQLRAFESKLGLMDRLSRQTRLIERLYVCTEKLDSVLPEKAELLSSIRELQRLWDEEA